MTKQFTQGSRHQSGTPFDVSLGTKPCTHAFSVSLRRLGFLGQEADETPVKLALRNLFDDTKLGGKQPKTGLAIVLTRLDAECPWFV